MSRLCLIVLLAALLAPASRGLSAGRADPRLEALRQEHLIRPMHRICVVTPDSPFRYEAPLVKEPPAATYVGRRCVGATKLSGADSEQWRASA